MTHRNGTEWVGPSSLGDDRAPLALCEPGNQLEHAWVGVVGGARTQRPSLEAKRAEARSVVNALEAIPQSHVRQLDPVPLPYLPRRLVEADDATVST